MNLGARLDRLRGSRQAPSAKLAQRLDVLGIARGTGRNDCTTNDPAALARALSGRLTVEGVVECRSEHQLPPLLACGADLDELPGCPAGADADWCYLDTETTGLAGGSGTLAFMVGLARWKAPDRLELMQWVLPSFAAERAMLTTVCEALADESVIVSYNGRAFDMPLLQARTRLHRVDRPLSQDRQLDLMHAVRRLYRERWSDCRLQTAERHLLGLVRHDDLPGAEAPLAWRTWLTTAVVQPLRRVLAHNEQDICSLALLHRRLPGLYDGDGLTASMLPNVARSWLRARRPERAFRLLWDARSALTQDGKRLLAVLCRRRGDWEAAESIWLDLCALGDRAAALELSKYHEHRRRDYGQAMTYALVADDMSCERRRRRLSYKDALPRQLSLPV